MKTSKLKTYIIQKLKSEISPALSYHGVHHTIEVLDVCNEYIKRLKIDRSKAGLLRTAALFHDTGFIWTYTHHEERGAEFAREILPAWGYQDDEIEAIGNMIMATKIPQNPRNLLEEILCDADLDYLGTNRFFTTGKTLYQELFTHNVIQDEVMWDQLQINFLSNHLYHTDFAKKNREPVKRKYLANIIKKREMVLDKL
jgi:HD superfamily phosphodiesterase